MGERIKDKDLESVAGGCGESDYDIIYKKDDTDWEPDKPTDVGTYTPGISFKDKTF